MNWLQRRWIRSRVGRAKKLFAAHPDISDSLAEKISRNDLQDQIYLGTVVQNATNGEFGTLLNLLVNGLIEEELALSISDKDVNSDRVLGRIEGVQKVIDRIESCIVRKDHLTEDMKEEQQVNAPEEYVSGVDE